MFRNESDGVGRGGVSGQVQRPLPRQLPRCSRGAVPTGDVELFDDAAELGWLMAEFELTEEEVRELRAADWL